MKNRTLLTLCTFLGLFLNVSISLSQERIGEIKIDENYKNITNLSGALTETISFHLLMNKKQDPKSFETNIAFFDKKGLTKTINLGSHKKKPTFLAFHKNGMVLTLVQTSKEKTIVHDVDYETGKVNSVEIDKKAISVFSHQEATILVLGKSEYLLDLAFITSSQDIKRQRFAFKPGPEKSILFYLNNTSTDFVDNETFIDKGFIKSVRAFYRDSSLTLVRDDKRKKVINLIKLAPKKLTELRQIQLKSEGRIKKLNSFIVDDLVFAFSMGKKVANLSIFNLETLELVKNFEYNVDDFGIVNKVVRNGVEETNSFNPKRFYKSYFPQAVGSVYNAELYVGVNKTKEGNYIVQVGHVDENTFRNANSGNFWWHYPAFGLNYDASSGNLAGGLDLSNATMLVFNALAEKKRKGNFFEINLDANLEPTNEASQLAFDYFNLERYQNKLARTFELKRFFLIPLQDEVRFINFDKKTNSYQVYQVDKID
jgi:hypothetical protein